MDFETIILKKQDHIATITLNRPDRLNAVNSQMMRELPQALKDVAQDDDVRVVVLTGAGRAFCAGADTTGMGGGGAAERTLDTVAAGIKNQQGIVLSLQNMEKPTIAMVNGAAVGMGGDIALSCDMRTGAENTRFLCGFVKIGLFPGFGAAWLYPRLMGIGKAMELMFTGDPLSAQEAQRMGVLNMVVPPDKLEAETMAFARKIANGPPLAIKLMKAQVREGLNLTFAQSLEKAAHCEAITLLSADHKEGVTAMREKREANFQGK